VTGRHAAPASPLAALDTVERDNARRRALALCDSYDAWVFGPAGGESLDWPVWAGQASAILKELAR
jgi:hypothetical protein